MCIRDRPSALARRAPSGSRPWTCWAPWPSAAWSPASSPATLPSALVRRGPGGSKPWGCCAPWRSCAWCQ
eukprot:9887068-Alexandrium_andersonii.AAC.1